MYKSSYFIEQIQLNRTQILSEWSEKLTNIMNKQKLSEVISDQAYLQICNEYIEILINHLKNTDIEDKVSAFSQKAIQLGWTIGVLMEGLNEFAKLLFLQMTENGSDKAEIELVWDFDKWINPLNYKIYDQYATSWEKTVSLQKIALRELSAPLIPIFDNITVMPLVGTIDTERARYIMENLLQGVVKYRSQVVLIDITGVPVVDTMVAHHIIQVSEAVRLVGAKCLLVGIRPEIAQTIVNLGIDLTQIMTKNTLQKGIAAALELTNRKIISMGE